MEFFLQFRYDHVPNNLYCTLLPQHDPNEKDSGSNNNKPSTFGFRPTYPTTWGSPMKMGPELFNTVARYLYHRRWIWSIEDPKLPNIGANCGANVLSTLLKYVVVINNQTF